MRAKYKIVYDGSHYYGIHRMWFGLNIWYVSSHSSLEDAIEAVEKMCNPIYFNKKGERV
jgi:hypothetical protein